MRLLLALLLAVGLSQAASAQLMGAAELKVAVPIKGAASSRPIADIYYLAGEVGAKETYTLTVKGPAAITLFGPDGSELLTTTGSGKVKLEVVLPFTDVFTVAIARKLSAQPYTLARSTTVPTFFEAAVAFGAGYGTNDGTNFQCWLIPGVKLRSVNGDETVDFTLAADRMTATFFAKRARSGETSSGEFKQTFDGLQVHEVSTPHGHEANEVRYPLEVTRSPDAFGRFRGYRCED
jgi:hypothetical protein